MTESLLVEREGAVAIVSINDAPYNRMTLDFVDRLEVLVGEIAADDFFQGMFATALEEGEIVTEVKFPVPEKAHYEKFIQPASRFPLVAVFVAKFSDGARVAVTGASENGVFRWTEAEQALSSNFSADAVANLKVDGSSMISDLHGSGDYRAHLVGVMTKRAVAALS